MAGTTNYNFPTYGATDAPDLLTGYNVAIQGVDTKLKELSDAISASGEPTSPDDPTLTVTQLGKAKVNANGFIYFSEE